MNSTLSLLITYLKKEKINIDFNEFIFQLETHPDFPSLYSISDTLTFFKIENLAARLRKEDVDELPDRFIALLSSENQSPYFALVEKQNKRYKIVKNNEKKSFDEDYFLNIWQGIVLVVENNNNGTSMPKNKLNLTWIYLSILITLLTTIIISKTGANFACLTLFGLSLFGSYLSYEVLQKIFGVNSAFSSTVCGSRNKVKSGCDVIINSSKAKLYGNLNLSDLTLIFFPGYLISLFLLSLIGYPKFMLDYSLFLLILGIPFISYSLYYQWNVEKQWCRICLLIVGVFFSQMTIVLIYGANNLSPFEMWPFLMLLFSFITSTTLWLALKPKIKDYFELKLKDTKSSRFKRNYSLFKLALRNSRHIKYESMNSLIHLGNPGSKLKLKLITNLFCKHCAGMHNEIVEIIKRYGNNIEVGIHFNLALHNNEEADLLHYRLLEIYSKESNNAFMEALGKWFQTMDINLWFSNFGIGSRNDTMESLLKLQLEEIRINKFYFTPTLIVGEFIYPEIYDRSDLIYYISELMEDQDLALD